ncbi:MAG: hypothetical protein ABI840_09510 [bacterium]
MKKLILFFFVILLAHKPHLYSQSGWIAQHSGTTVKLNKVFFINSHTGWIVGDSGRIIKTTNDGANWFSQNSNTTHTLVSVHFINEFTGYITGGNKNLFTFSFIKILKTTNGGTDWILVYDSADLENWVSDINFLNSLTGFVICEGVMGLKLPEEF